MITAQVSGRLTQDPELTYGASGKPNAKLSIASDLGRKGQDGKYITDYIDGRVFFQATAEYCANNLVKGQSVFVSGKLESRDFEAPDGSKRRFWSMNIDSVEAGPKPGGARASGANQEWEGEEDPFFDE